MRVGGIVLVFATTLVACRAEKAPPSRSEESLPQASAHASLDDRPRSPEAPPAPTAASPGAPSPEPDGAGRPSKAKRAPMLASTKSLTDPIKSQALEEVIGANIQRFVPCTKVDSVVTVRATIAPDGHVLEATSSAADPDDAFTRDCVAKAFASLTFPKMQSSRPSPVTFDLSLKPQGT